ARVRLQPAKRHREHESAVSLPINFEVPTDAAELNCDNIAARGVDSCAVGGTQTDFCGAAQIICSIEAGFTAWIESNCFVKRVALSNERIFRMVFLAVRVVAVDPVLIVVRWTCGRVR